jgi:hypothetical protein
MSESKHLKCAIGTLLDAELLAALRLPDITHSVLSADVVRIVLRALLLMGRPDPLVDALLFP